MNTYEEMNNVLKDQKEFFIKNGAPSIDLRIDRLQRLKSLIMDNRYDFVDASTIKGVKTNYDGDELLESTVSIENCQ